MAIGQLAPLAADRETNEWRHANPPPPSPRPLQGNTLVRPTGGVVSAHFGPIYYFACYKDHPLVRATGGAVSVQFWDFSVAVARRGCVCVVPATLHAQATGIPLCAWCGCMRVRTPPRPCACSLRRT